jgi:hypothetical protein
MNTFKGNLVNFAIFFGLDIVYVCKVVLSWLVIGAGFILAGWMAPSLVTGAIKPVLIFCSIFGFASGIADVATERLGFGGTRRS